MKKFFLILITLLALFSFAHAQIKKGSFISGVGISSIRFSFTKEYKYFSATVGPSGYYFINDHLGVGGIFGGMIEYSSNIKKTNIYGYFVPTARYYFGEPSMSRFFVQGGIAPSGPTLGNLHLAILLTGGYNYFFSKNLALEVGLTYRHNTDMYTNQDRIGVNFGILLYFPSLKNIL